MKISTPLALPRSYDRSSLKVVIAVILLGILIVWLAYWPPSADSWSTFTNVFLGIFIEAIPFLMLGTLASGIVEVFVDPNALKQLLPRSVVLSAICGGMMGLFFPVCECGVVPLVRRLFRKGMPIPAGVAFLMAAPVINPIVILSTATAFGFGKVLLMRVGFTFLVAVIIGLVFGTARTPWEILRPTPWISAETSVISLAVPTHNHEDEHDHDHEHSHQAKTTLGKIFEVFQVTLDEFFEIGRYLIMGAMIAAALQAFVPQSILFGIGTGPIISVLVMMALAVLLSICSTVDSFVVLGFVGTFSLGAIIAFLVYGAMVDIKSTLMYLRVFRTRATLYLVILPFFLVLLIGVVVNFYLGG